MLLDLPRLALLPERDRVRETDILLQSLGNIPLGIVGLRGRRRERITRWHCLGVLEYMLAPPF